jgi:hypothetical protein
MVEKAGLSCRLVDVYRGHHGWLERHMLDEVGGLDERVEPSVRLGRRNVCRVTDRLVRHLVDVCEGRGRGSGRVGRASREDGFVVRV